MGDRLIHAGKVLIVSHVCDWRDGGDGKIGSAHVRPAEDGEVTDEDREAIAAGRRVTLALRGYAEGK